MTTQNVTTDESTALHEVEDIYIGDITEFNFDPTLNVRAAHNYAAGVERKVNELLKDRAIRTPLVACQLITQSADELPVGACGFLRAGALNRIRVEYPGVYEECFYKKVPFIVHTGMSERQRLQLLMDHGSEEPLDELSVYLSQKRLMRQKGLFTQEAMIYMLHGSYYRLASVKDRAKFDTAMRAFRKDGYISKGNSILKSESEIAFVFFRGRFQYFQRIFESVPQVEEAYIAYLEGKPNGVDITFKLAEDLHKATPTMAIEMLNRIREEGKKPKEDLPKAWSRTQIVEAHKTAKSEYLKAQLTAATGDAKAQASLPDLEDELLVIEKAKNLDSGRFWATVHAIIEEAENI